MARQCRVTPVFSGLRPSGDFLPPRQPGAGRGRNLPAGKTASRPLLISEFACRLNAINPFSREKPGLSGNLPAVPDTRLLETKLLLRPSQLADILRISPSNVPRAGLTTNNVLMNEYLRCFHAKDRRNHSVIAVKTTASFPQRGRKKFGRLSRIAIDRFFLLCCKSGISRSLHSLFPKVRL